MEANPYYQQSQAEPQLQYVGVGRRFLALLIDTIILGAINSIIYLPFRSGHTGYDLTSAIISVIVAIIAIAYTFGLEATRGATLGKMALGIRVVKLDGTPIGWRESIIRNLLRIIDGLFSYLVGAILVWTSPTRQRLGDRLANTVVVRRQS